LSRDGDIVEICKTLVPCLKKVCRYPTEITNHQKSNRAKVKTREFFTYR